MSVLRLLPLLMLGACTSMPDVTSIVKPYRIDIQQGNYVSQEMVAQLKPGMTRDQVRFVLGTPLLSDIFHGERWDYIYMMRPGKGQPQERKLTVFFEDGKLSRVAGDVVAAQPGEQEAARAAKTQVIDIGADTKEKDKKPDAGAVTTQPGATAAEPAAAQPAQQ